MLDKLVKKIYKGKATPAQLDKALTEFYASEFWKAVIKGFDINIDDIDFDSLDAEMLKQLQKSIYQFASAKNYTQLKALSQALVDESGALRSFSQFRIAAAEINNEFVNQWLKAEYNHAVAASQMASRWQDIQKDKQDLPLLKYNTVGDDRVRPEHRELDNITLPVDHPFWDEYYPPNGWNCRCDVQQLDSGKITDYSKVSLPEKMPAIFKYNAGKQGIVFPPGHPYYDGMPDDVRQQGSDLYEKNRFDK